jgi:hypothetical protein
MAHDPGDFLWLAAGGWPAQVASRPTSPHNSRMAGRARNPLSTDTFLTVLGIVAGIGAIVFDQWAVKAPLVLLGLVLIVYAGRRHGSHPVLRYPIALAAIGAFSFLPWHGIWEDFHKSYPAVAWPVFVTRYPFKVALAAVCALALGWDLMPVWRIRHRIFVWRKALTSEGVWIDRDTALKVIRDSQWARLRAPAQTLAEMLTRSFLASPDATAFQANQLRFNVYLDMTLGSFETSNSDYVRTVEGKKEYLEEKLRLFLATSLRQEAIKQFGPLPNSRV